MPALNLVGKSYLVTGSTDGIGLHTAQKLFRSGATVLVHGRSASRVKQALQQLEQAGGEGKAQGFVADLSSFKEVERLADEVKGSLNGQPLNVLINNAGVYEKQKAVSADGLEMTWAINVAAPFLLTSKLIDVVNKRVVNVSSISAASDIDFGNLQQERGYSAHNAYSLSKLCNQLFNHALAERLQRVGSTITANTLDPGTVNTKMLLAGWGMIGIPVSQANDLFKVATDPGLDGVTGTYFISGRERSSPSVARDTKVQRQLWEILEKQTGAQWCI